jgi:hypothetical protein
VSCEQSIGIGFSEGTDSDWFCLSSDFGASAWHFSSSVSIAGDTRVMNFGETADPDPGVAELLLTLKANKINTAPTTSPTLMIALFMIPTPVNRLE